MRAFKTLQRFWRLLAHYLRPQTRRMSLLALILCCNIGVQAIVPLLAGYFIDQATSGAMPRELILLAVVTIGVALAGQGLGVAETYVAEQVSWAATNALRDDLLARLLRLDATFHNAHTPGELIERVDGDVATLARFFSRFVVYVVGSGGLMVGVLGLLLYVDWRVGLGLSAFTALALLATLHLRARAIPSWAAERQASADFYGFLGEYLGGLEDIRSSGAGPFVLRRCAQEMRSWLAATRAAGMRGYATIATSQGLFALGATVALALSAVLFQQGSLTIGAVYLVFQYTELLRRPTEQLRDEIQELQQADASLGRIETLMGAESRLPEGHGAALPPGPLGVELRDVSFAYAGGAAVLRDISVNVAPGRVLGVVGRTGSGKTTLTRLVARFYDPVAGAVRLGGVDPREVRLAAVRERLGLVTQEVHLFNATVRDNLSLFDAGLPDGRLVTALESLGLGGWLGELPRGLDTLLGAGGAGLSAGEAQLLACARVFLRDPDIVILDEASSRLDPVTERHVHTALGRLLEGRTGIIVAHRLETVALADDILVLERGQVSEYGSRPDLAADPDSAYSRLLRLAASEEAP